MAENILEMRSITKTFPGVKALENVNLDVRRGEIHAICGENGAGKSTLMKVLSGVYPTGTYDGEILYDGAPASFGGIRDSEHLGIVIIHQELALVPYLSIAENIFLGNERRGRGGLIDWNLANAEAAKLLQSVGLDEYPVTPVGQLGVGKQQLVEIAKALSKDVRLLILDEPTAALNDTDSAHLLGLLRRLKERGITSIMISHKLNEITAIADRVTILRDGHTITTLPSEGLTEERIISGMVGRDLDNRFPPHEPTIARISRASSTSSRATSSASMLRPSRSTVIESATPSTSFSLCEMMMQVIPWALNSRIRSSSLRLSSSFSAAVGSSMISRRTFLDSALAISTSCCLPTPMSAIRVDGFSFSPTRASSPREWLSVSFQLTTPARACSLPRKMFSAIDRYGISASSWWMITTPRSSLERMSLKLHGSPSIRIWPS